MGNTSGKDRRSGDKGKTWSGKGKPLPRSSDPAPESKPADRPQTGQTWSGQDK